MYSTCLYVNPNGVPYINGFQTVVSKQKGISKYLYKYFKCSLWPCLIYVCLITSFSSDLLKLQKNWDSREIRPQK